jgi:uncharacterized NAD(P)/FAD-binding protein YdhS/predicted metal-dependent enzyme (double-stranded beta helix superfamily)
MPAMSRQEPRGFEWLKGELDARAGKVDETTTRQLLAQLTLSEREVLPYVERRADAYSRRCVVRREGYELLVLTWGPGQGSAAHDHSGSLCGLKVLEGTLTEQLYELGQDGNVRATTRVRGTTGQIVADPGVAIHALANTGSSDERLVTVHLYAPPLPEVRRYAVATEPPAAAFVRQRPPEARVIAILGGGFTGTMALANLLRRSKDLKCPLHLVLFDRQPALGEGVAYRTNDSRHLLNVPAEKMSAWPDRPLDFLAFAATTDPSVGPHDFLPRKVYGRYVRQTLLELVQSCGERVSVELVRDDATGLSRAPSGGWDVTSARGRGLRADVAIVALGHRPPDEDFAGRFKGPRSRFVTDPWAALVLSQIGPDEPVLLLGSGLTAVDAILTLDREGRTAPLTVVSRRGLFPLPHTRTPQPAADVSALVGRWLSTTTTLRELVQTLRRAVRDAAERGVDWRQVIDGLRPSIARVWGRLSMVERSRFLAHVRPFWEVHRHRMAPDVADRLALLRQKRILEVTPGALLYADADESGVDVTLRRRGDATPRRLRVAWVVNCTGPGAHNRHSTHPILRPLLEAGVLREDELGLGLCTDPDGRAMSSSGEVHSSLLVAGTLRKSTLWESTAVPELRQQAAAVAEIALQVLQDSR